MLSFLLFLLPIAAITGWFAANKKSKNANYRSGMVPKDYLLGLNFLLNEQPDKAVDVFIKMLEVDSDTVETHLALGSLFRRRGEVDRAIRIHQNLIARPHLNKQQRIQALMALGQDYMRAGVLDRAERIFLEIVDNGEETSASLHNLLDIYQQEKAWEQAATIANKIEKNTGESMQSNIAHYYCEQAIQARALNDNESARKYLRKALAVDKQCVRASLLQGDVEAAEQRYRVAIRFYQQIKLQDSDFLSEAIVPMAACFEKLGELNEFIAYLNECLAEHSRISVILLLSDYVLQQQGVTAAIDLIADYLSNHPSIRGLMRLIELQLLPDGGRNKENLYILQGITSSMLKNKPHYRCHQCGFSAKTLLWLCPGCKNWNTVKPIHGLEGD